MKTLKLSNGTELTAHVGDGFDGMSGLYITTKDKSIKFEENVEIPKKDLKKVISFIKTYIKEEMGLHEREGGISLIHGKIEIPSDLSSPYKAIYYLGYLKSQLKP